MTGPTVTTALSLCQRKRAEVHRFIVCPWDRPGDSVTQVHRSYNTALRALRATEPLDCYLSVKFPSLRYDIGRAEAVVALGAANGIRIHFDALGPESVDQTLKLIEYLRGRYTNVGSTVSARWRRSVADICRLTALGVPIRIVKGQLPDRTGGETDPTTGFLRLADEAQKATTTVGIATHDHRLAARAIKLLKSANVPCELEQLYRLPLVRETARLGTPLRLYVPYGHGYPPYDPYVAVKKPLLGLRLLGDFARGCFMKPTPS